MRLKVFFLFLLIACPSSGVLAQEKPGLFSRIERVFQEKEPAWKVERTYPGRTSDPLRQSITFRSEEGQASVDVTVWRREKDAQDVFAAESNAFDSAAGKRMSKEELAGLGDENHVWTNRGGAPWTTIRFRKGNVYVTVFAPSPAVAKRFARRVLGQIAAG
jgi:hypothetical protein